MEEGEEGRSKHYFIDLFGGAGGFSEGLKQAGFEHLVGVEIDPLFAESYRSNHGNVIVDDIRNINKSDIDKFVGDKRVSLIAASPPCQSFSTCGPRKSNDPKDSLYEEVLRIVGMYRPRWVVIENVPGLLTKRVHGGAAKIIDNMVDSLQRIGYHVDYRVLSADDFEVPQRRRRVVIIGALDAPRDVVYPGPVRGFDPAVKHVLAAEADVGEKYFWPLHRREYFAAKPQYVKYLDVDEPCCTLRACYAKNRGADACVRYAPDRIRSLTEEECAAIQTFPRGYKFAGCMSKVYQQIGNAIPVNLAKHVGMALLQNSSTEM